MVKSTTVSFVIRSSSMKIISPFSFKLLSPSMSLRPSQTNKITNMAPSNAITVEEIINGFPNPNLPKLDHEPTFEDIHVTTRILDANAISVHSMSGGGSHGHLGIIMNTSGVLFHLRNALGRYIKSWIHSIPHSFHQRR
jgi:hypothetical protein